jgi:hypothetical protein
MALEMALVHHNALGRQRLYPQGLAGEAIYLSGRITKLADAYDTLRSQRSYKPAFDHASAVDIHPARGPVYKPPALRSAGAGVLRRPAPRNRENISEALRLRPNASSRVSSRFREPSRGRPFKKMHGTILWNYFKVIVYKKILVHVKLAQIAQ